MRIYLGWLTQYLLSGIIVKFIGEITDRYDTFFVA